MAGSLIQLARFTTVTSALQPAGSAAGVGVFVRPWTPLQLVQVGYSFYDHAGVFVPSTNTFQSRVAVLRGFYDGDPTAFTVNTDLSRWALNIIGDFFLNDVGPGVIPFHPDTEESIFEGADGASILLAAAQTNAVGTQFVGKLSPLSRTFLHTGLLGRHHPLGAAAAAASGAGANSQYPGSHVHTGNTRGTPRL